MIIKTKNTQIVNTNDKSELPVASGGSLYDMCQLHKGCSSCQDAGDCLGGYVTSRPFLRDISLNKETFTTAIVDYGKLHNLLAPKHSYFDGKRGTIKEFARWRDDKESKVLCYPRVQLPRDYSENDDGDVVDKPVRDNPYRLMQLKRKASGKTARSLLNFIKAYNLADFKVADITLTEPAIMSRYMAGRGSRGRSQFWRMSDRFWAEMVSRGLLGDGHARSSNLHIWQTKKPLEPHFHQHTLVPNYERVSDYRSPDDSAWQAYQLALSNGQGADVIANSQGSYKKGRAVAGVRADFIKRPYSKRGPYSDGDRRLISAIWLDLLLKYCARHGIDAWDNQTKLISFARRRGVVGLCRLIGFKESLGLPGLVNVDIRFIPTRSDADRARLLHKLNYKGRSWQEDYAVYSNIHTDCDNPPVWLDGYSNHTRIYGYWSVLNKLLIGLDAGKDDKKLSPYNAESMVQLSPAQSMGHLIDMADGQSLLAVDFIKGRPIERALTVSDIEWLRSVTIEQYDDNIDGGV